MLLSGGGRCGRDVDAAERPRPVRERLEAAVSGLGELEFLRRRQEDLVRAALELREAAEEEEEEVEEEERRREEQRSSEEKLLEENILLLRRQLNCLRRRDVGLLSQLQELDRQISDLRLDSDVSHDLPEVDSRPSSGFYELSDAASGSLSNSSNSVFSECFCTTIDPDGRVLTGATTDEAPGCSECDGVFGGLWDDSASAATVRRSLSAPQPPAPDASPGDVQPTSHCDPASRSGGGGDAFGYPSPLHAVSVLGPSELLGHGGDGPKPETPSFVPPSSSWPAASSSLSSSLSPPSSSQTPPHRRLDGYIFTLLQRRVQPVRPCRPRTSISTDPSKSVLRQASLCSRQLSGPGSGPGPSLSPGLGLGPGTLRASDLQATVAAAAAAVSSPQRKAEEPDAACSDSTRGLVADQEVNSLRKQSKVVLPLAAAAPPKSFQELGSAALCSSRQPLLKPPPQSGPSRTRPRPSHAAPAENSYVPGEGPVMASAPTPDQEGRSHGAKSISIRHKVQKSGSRKGGRSKGAAAATPKATGESEHVEVPPVRGGEKSHRRRAKGPRILDDGRSAHTAPSRRGVSSRAKRVAAPQADGGAEKPGGSVPRGVRPAASKHHHHGNHHHHRRHQHGREPVVVVTKLKHKRDDYQRLRAAAEIPYDEALRRAQRRQRKELPGPAATAAAAGGGRVCSPYALAAASDSEYSAECASLFHSTIVDTSEDEASNYTANRFGDSESGEDARSTSGTEESGGGGAGRARGRGGPAGQEATATTTTRAKACVKIKASHNLKKKILRFRSGSLKLMTTV